MHRLIHPNYTINVNEVGGDTRQKGDGHIGGLKFITSPLKKLTTRTADNNNNFIVMCSTYYNGKPVICLIVVIFVQKKLEHEIGIYVFVYIVETKTILMIIKNIGPRNRFPGESNCEFRGKEVPCMLYCRKKEGFTSEIITD